MITASYYKRTKRAELEFGRKRILVKDKDLDDPSLFPLVLHGENPPWKLSLDYDL